MVSRGARELNKQLHVYTGKEESYRAHRRDTKAVQGVGKTSWRKRRISRGPQLRKKSSEAAVTMRRGTRWQRAHVSHP